MTKQGDRNNGDFIEYLKNIGSEYGFDDDFLSSISSLPFEEAFAKAYRQISENGHNAEVVLADFWSSEDN